MAPLCLAPLMQVCQHMQNTLVVGEPQGCSCAPDQEPRQVVWCIPGRQHSQRQGCLQDSLQSVPLSIAYIDEDAATLQQGMLSEMVLTVCLMYDPRSVLLGDYDAGPGLSSIQIGCAYAAHMRSSAS